MKNYTKEEIDKLIEHQQELNRLRKIKQDQIASKKPYWCAYPRIPCKRCKFNKRCLYTRKGMKFQGNRITTQKTLGE